MSAQGAFHPWFKSTTGTTFTSHNGWSDREKIKEGTLEAFLEARRRGYRWMQIDAIPIRDQLISGHVLLGLLRPRLRNKTLAELRSKDKAVASLRTILTHEVLHDVHWNIELKSKHGVGYLLDLLEELATKRDLSTIMISSPIRRSTLRAVAVRFPNVALAAPFLHGGVHGLWNRPVAPDRPYDCQQCWQGLSFLKPIARNGRTLRQFWTICSRRSLHKGAEKGRTNMIVDSARLSLPNSDTGRVDCVALPDEPPTMVALGGGGWRGGFGGIGAVLYFAETGLWNGMREVVGISGGAFATAALSAECDDTCPVSMMSELCMKLERASKTVGKLLVIGLPLAVAYIVAVGYGVNRAWVHRNPWALAAIVVLFILMLSFLVRSYITLYWRIALRGLYGKETMRDAGGISKHHLGRRYRIGTTGIGDGNIYSYTTHLAGDRVDWLADKACPIPVPDRDRRGRRRAHKLSDVVLRSTSLPGLRQVGFGRIYLCDHSSKREHTADCWVPDRLVDGGVSGIFGRGLIEKRRIEGDFTWRLGGDGECATALEFGDLTQAFSTSRELADMADEPPAVGSGSVATVRATVPRTLGLAVSRTVVARNDMHNVFATEPDVQLVIVDAGRALTIRGTRTFRDRWMCRGEGASTIWMLARWLQVALGVGYQNELKLVEDGKRVDGYGFRLVRLAEEEAKKLRAENTMATQRQLELNRLSLLRDRVHKFSLLKANRGWANRALAVSIGACALEFAKDPDLRVDTVLESIGRKMCEHGYDGKPNDLADVWRNVPVLGEPSLAF